MREYVPYGPLSRICAQNRAEFVLFALRIARRPHAVARRMYVTEYGTDGPGDGAIGFICHDDRFLQEKADKFAQECLGELLVRYDLGAAGKVAGGAERGRKVDVWLSGKLRSNVIGQSIPSKWHASLSAVPFREVLNRGLFFENGLYTISYSFLF